MEASNPSRAHPWRQKVASYSIDGVAVTKTIFFSAPFLDRFVQLLAISSTMCFGHDFPDSGHEKIRNPKSLANSFYR